MKRALAFLLAALALVLPGTAALEQASAHSGARVVRIVRWVEEWDPASGKWVRVEDSPESIAPASFEGINTDTSAGPVSGTEIITLELAPFTAASAGGVQYGPFRVLDGKRGALVGPTDVDSLAAFKAMLAAYPELEVIEFHDASGTSNDLANLAVGRAIRAAGLATHVPEGGSARSGAVELFLAGTHRSMDPGALFAVHSWRDAYGREPDDFAADVPENQLYLDYYADMGMSRAEARAFYAMTNSVSHEGALWLRGAQMARWVAPDTAPRAPAARMLGAPVEIALRLALARSGEALASAWRAPWSLSRTAVVAPWLTPSFAPVLVYANEGAGLLDSAPAFP